MDGMGIAISLNIIPRRISPEKWRQVYRESLKLLEAYDFMEKIRARRNGLTYFFAGRARDRENLLEMGCHGWIAAGDLHTGECTQEFPLLEDVRAYMPAAEDEGGEILLNALEGIEGAGRMPACVDIWGGRTNGADSHIYLLAVACLIVSRFPEAAMVSGDISAGQCRRAVRWANEHLELPISVPDTGRMERLLMRLRSSSLPGESLLDAFYQLTDEAKDLRMGEFLRGEFSRQELYDFYRGRFSPYEIYQRGFVRIMKEYLEMGFDFRELCRLAVSDSQGVQASPEEFLRRVLESKLHVKEKETGDIAGSARERADCEQADTRRELSARIFCMLTGMENRNVNAFYPIERIREDCQEVFGGGAVVDRVAELLREKETSAIDSLQDLLYDGPDDALRRDTAAREAAALFGMGREPQEKGYDVNSYRELTGFVPGSRVKPDLEEDLIEHFCALHEYAQETFEEFRILKRTERENYLIQETAGLLLLEEAWEQIFDRIMDDAYIVRIYGVLGVDRTQKDGALFCRCLFSNLKAIDYYWEKTEK